MNYNNLHNLLSARANGRIPLSPGIVAALAVHGDDAYFCLHSKRSRAISQPAVASALAIVAEYADAVRYYTVKGFSSWELKWRD